MTAALLGTAFVTFVPAMLRSDRMALSETLFVVVTLAFLLAIETVVGRANSPPWTALILPTMLIWIGYSLRYVGMVLLITGVLLLLLQIRRWGSKVSVGLAAVLAVAGGSLPAAWMVRNTLVGDGPQGGRTVSDRSLAVNTGQFVKTVSSFVAPPPTPLRLVALGVVVLVIALGLRRGVRSGVVTSDTVRPLGPVIAFVIVYSFYVIAAASRYAIDPIDARLLTPSSLLFLLL